MIIAAFSKVRILRAKQENITTDVISLERIIFLPLAAKARHIITGSIYLPWKPHIDV